MGRSLGPSRREGPLPDAALRDPSRAAFVAARDRLAGLLAEAPVGRLRLAKRTTNLFRPRARRPGVAVDPTPFARVLAVDPEGRTADVGGTTTYEDLVEATLAHGLVPLVVPELRTITLGGAVSGVGIESTSFRSGLPHESVLEVEVVTGAGEVVVATREGPHADLFLGLPNSYGTLGYAVRLRIELEPAHPAVRIRNRRFPSAAAALELIDEVARTRRHAGESVDFCEAVAYAPDEVVVSLGAWSDARPPRRDPAGPPHHRLLRERPEDVLRVHDYFFRWDPDWFWCSRAFGLDRALVRALWPRRWRRSDVYRRLLALDERLGLSARLARLRGRPVERVVQDVQVPLERTADFLAFLDRQTGQRPVWLCPFRSRDGTTRWPLFPLDPARSYVNVGFWGTAPLPPGAGPGHHDRAIEREVAALGGLKALYSTSSYSREELARLYGGDAYRALKERYDPAGRLLDLYDKVVGGR
jgi:FAD/FMN-containing dehydrogenase